MNQKKILQFLNYFYNSSNIPVRLYKKKELVLSLPSFEKAYDPFTFYLQNIFMSTQTTMYFTTPQFIYYGFVKNLSYPDLYITVGPVSSTLCSRETVKEILKHASISLEYIDLFSEMFSSIPLISFDRFLHSLCFFNYVLNEISLSIQDIWDYTTDDLLHPISMEHTSTIYDAKENMVFHNSYHFENHYLKLIELGDIFSLKKLFTEPIRITPGTVASTSLRQTKNIFIACATLVTRSSIKGGLDSENAYHLSDTYIRQMEKLQTLESIYSLQYQMIFDFAKRVATSKIPDGISPLIYECLHYVSIHSNRPLSVLDVANHVNRSRSFISRKFKEEVGIGLNDFIIKKKLEEAKGLLTYSDKSLSEISYYLCFSSQSYFQNVFKKFFELTPNEYRLKTSLNKELTK
jgi:AraC-like DNA-binding protein